MAVKDAIHDSNLLKTLLEAGTALSSSLELEQVLDTIMDWACRIFKAGASSLLLIDEATNTLYFKTATGEQREELKRIRMKMGEGIAGWVAEHNEPLIVNDARSDERHAKDIPDTLGFSTRNILCVPLTIGGKVIGVIEVLNKLKGDFNQGDQEALLILSRNISTALENARRFESVQTESERFHEMLSERYKIIGESELFKTCLGTLEKAAKTTSTILLRGESGTGKEVAARYIHKFSLRANKPLISVNCAAIADTLLESELFGYERGAFTGADKLKKGKFELADGGTIFLDEIGNMSPAIQSKVLRVIQEKEIDRLGGEKTIPVDVRIIAATNSNLEDAIKEGSFREDLFYRLNVISVLLPPLRSRREDIPLLVDHFVARYNRETNKNIRGISSKALNLLMNYAFPGNIRELENIVERAIVLEDSELIQPEQLPIQLRQSADPAMELTSQSDSFPTLDEIERLHIIRALREGGTKTAACKLLGISRPTLDRKVDKYNITVPKRR